jgi:hypothetical protein
LKITGDIWLFGKPRVVQNKDLDPKMKMMRMGKQLKSMKHTETNVSTLWHNIIHRHQFQQVPKDSNAKNINEQ